MAEPDFEYDNDLPNLATVSDLDEEDDLDYAVGEPEPAVEVPLATTNFEHLKQAILQSSFAKADWSAAKLEWELEDIFVPNGTCACTHRPITERCRLKNKINRNTLVVGNVCIKHFERKDLTASCSRAFAALQRIRKNCKKNRANKPLILVCANIGIIGPRQAAQYLVSMRKRTKITPKEREVLLYLNRKMVYALIRPRIACRYCETLLFARRSTNRHAYYGCSNTTCVARWIADHTKSVETAARFAFTDEMCPQAAKGDRNSPRNPVQKGDVAWCLANGCLQKRVAGASKFKQNTWYLRCSCPAGSSQLHQRDIDRSELWESDV